MYVHDIYPAVCKKNAYKFRVVHRKTKTLLGILGISNNLSFVIKQEVGSNMQFLRFPSEQRQSTFHYVESLTIVVTAS